jgi:hypothetical protein
MNYRGLTAREINLEIIKKTLNNVSKGKLTKQEVAKELNKRFERLKTENVGMYEEYYPKYIKIYKTL